MRNNIIFVQNHNHYQLLFFPVDSGGVIKKPDGMSHFPRLVINLLPRTTLECMVPVWEHDTSDRVIRTTVRRFEKVYGNVAMVIEALASGNAVYPALGAYLDGAYINDESISELEISDAELVD